MNLKQGYTLNKLSRIIRSITIVPSTLIATATSLNAQNYSISGTVRSLERTTGTPIENVLIDVDSSSYIARTDANGNFILNDIKPGNHNIRASANGYIGMFKQNYTLDNNKTFDFCLVDTLQESPEGKILFELDQLRELAPYETYRGLSLVNETRPNGFTWEEITEGNLIPIRLENATTYDSARFISSIGACDGDGDWSDSPTESIEYKQKREIYKLTNNLDIDGKTKRGILVKFDSDGNYTLRREDPYNNNYIYAAEVFLRVNMETTIQKEVFGRTWSRGDIFDRPSYMNSDNPLVTNLDHMLNIVFFNQWAAIGRNEQQSNILDMENTPITNIPNITTIINPPNNSQGLDQNVRVQFENEFGTELYRMQISDTEDFSNVAELELYRTDTTIMFDKNKELYIRVRPENKKGNAEWSNTVKISTITGIEDIISSEYKTYPNPCTEEIKIEYTLKKEALITNRIYNIFGQLQEEVAEQEKIPGKYIQTIDLQDFQPGVYILQTEIKTRNEVIQKPAKQILVLLPGKAGFN